MLAEVGSIVSPNTVTENNSSAQLPMHPTTKQYFLKGSVSGRNKQHTGQFESTGARSVQQERSPPIVTAGENSDKVQPPTYPVARNAVDDGHVQSTGAISIQQAARPSMSVAASVAMPARPPSYNAEGAPGGKPDDKSEIVHL